MPVAVPSFTAPRALPAPSRLHPRTPPSGPLTSAFRPWARLAEPEGFGVAGFPRPLTPARNAPRLKPRAVCAPSAQDITSLLHTIYEVVDSSVNHSPTSSKTLRVKLTVAPDGSQGTKGVLLGHPGEGWGPRKRVLGAAWGRGLEWVLEGATGGVQAGRPSMSAGGAAWGGVGAGGPAQEPGREACRTGGCETPLSSPGSEKPHPRAVGRLLGPAARDTGGGPGGQRAQEQTAHLAVSWGGLRPAGHQAQGGDQARRGAAKLGEEAARPAQV